MVYRTGKTDDEMTGRENIRRPPCSPETEQNNTLIGITSPICLLAMREIREIHSRALTLVSRLELTKKAAIEADRLGF